MKYNNSTEILLEIRKIMKTKGISVNELANRLNRSQPATSGLLRMKNVSLDTLKEIAEAINCEIEIEFKDTNCTPNDILIYTPDEENQ